MNQQSRYMRDELQQRYPYQFREPGAWQLPEGWSRLMGILCGLIDERLESAGYKNSKDKERIFGGWVQLKEKFGGGRYYVRYISRSQGKGIGEDIARLISDAEELAFSICERCGSAGVLREDLAWRRTLCNTHYEEVGQKHNLEAHHASKNQEEDIDL